jgi:hypothetical protein
LEILKRTVLKRAVLMRAVPASRRTDPKGRFLILASCLLGILSTSFLDKYANLVGLWSLVPLLWLETESRRSAFLVALAFYLSMSRGIVPGSYVFFQDGSFIRALVLWLASGAALSLPWGCLWVRPDIWRSPAKKALGVVAAILVSIPPPLGLIGWGSFSCSRFTLSPR